MGIYHLDASSRDHGSVTRKYSKYTVERLLKKHPNFNVLYRDLGKAQGLKFIDEEIASALFIAEDERSYKQKKALRPSDTIVKEAVENDIWVIGLPIYNFSMPATFKTWIDMLARSQKTFRYTDSGPVGLLTNKKVFVIIASGGTAIDSDVDYCTPWLRHFMTFVGVRDLTLIKADQYSDQKAKTVTMQIDSEVDKL